MSSPKRGISIMASLALSVITAPAAVGSPRQSEAAELARWRADVRLDFRFGTMSHAAMTAGFAPLGATLLEAGVAREDRFAERYDLLKHTGYHALLGAVDHNWAVQDGTADEIETTLWRYGIEESRGYGHRLRIAGGRLGFNNSGALAGYTLDLEGEAVALAEADSLTLAQFTTKTRFGDSWTGEMHFWFHRAVGISIGYERTVIFPGFKFGYWSASGALYSLVRWGMEEFIVAATAGAPGYVPILSFLVDSALGYTYYELRQEKMNWPFDTEPPLALDMFGIGLACRF